MPAQGWFARLGVQNREHGLLLGPTSANQRIVLRLEVLLFGVLQPQSIADATSKAPSGPV
jgi:hypothetical protein